MESAEAPGGGALSYIKENILAARRDIAAAAAATTPKAPPTLIAVSKTYPAAAVAAAAAAGQQHFGENYVKELIDKAKELPQDIRWHMIGNLQTNKVKTLVREVPNLFSVDSVDSEKLAAALQKEVLMAKGHLNVLIQVNAGGEEQKKGVVGATWPETEQAALSLASFIVKECPDLRFRGYMTVAPPDREEARRAFERMQKLKELTLFTPDLAPAFAGGEELELSMGMTSDMDLAIAHGSTQVRIGTRIFGQRPPKV